MDLSVASFDTISDHPYLQSMYGKKWLSVVCIGAKSMSTQEVFPGDEMSMEVEMEKYGEIGCRLPVPSVLKEYWEQHSMGRETQSSLTYVGTHCYLPSYCVTFEKLHNLSECHLLNYTREI